MVCAGVAADNNDEERIRDRQAIYFGYSFRFITGIYNFSSFGKDCLETEEAGEGEAKVNLGGWIFLILSWGLIIGLVVFCFVKVFAKKEK